MRFVLAFCLALLVAGGAVAMEPAARRGYVFVNANCDTASSDDIFIPNIFSPNGDLNNDVLYVRSHNIKTMELTIYNRWGEKVFESKDIDKGWDGTFKNSKCNEGVFVWYLNATLKDDKTIVKKGNITLIR